MIQHMQLAEPVLVPFLKPIPKAYLFTKKLQQLQSIDREIRKKWAQINAENKNKQIEHIKSLQEERKLIEQRAALANESGMLINNPINELIIGHRLNKVEKEKQIKRQAGALLRKRYYDNKYFGKQSGKSYGGKSSPSSLSKNKSKLVHFKEHLNREVSFKMKSDTTDNGPIIDCKLVAPKPTKNISPHRKRYRTQENVFDSVNSIKNFNLQNPHSKSKQQCIGNYTRYESNGFQKGCLEHLNMMTQGRRYNTSQQLHLPLMFQKRSSKKERLLKVICEQYNSEMKKMNFRQRISSEKSIDLKKDFLNKLRTQNSKVYYHLVSSWEPQDALRYMK